MLCTAEMTYDFKIEYWLLPKLAKGIRELYIIISQQKLTPNIVIYITVNYLSYLKNLILPTVYC